MPETPASVEYIVVLPHNQFRFKYRMNDGSYHFISKNDITNFFSRYIDLKDKRTLIDYVSRFRPFLIIPEDRTIFELSKTDSHEVRGSLMNLSEKEIMKIKTAMEEEKQDMIHNDTLLSRIHDKLLKK